jgi:hypothetical protein
MGPLWNCDHAKEKITQYVKDHPEFAANHKWTGHWWTTIPGRMSVA